MCKSIYVIQVDLLWGVTRPLAWSGGDELKHIFLVKHSFVKSLKMNFFQLASALDLRRRVEFIYQSEVRSEIGAISAGIINFLDRVFR